jgi:hypothetical protein
MPLDTITFLTEQLKLQIKEMEAKQDWSFIGLTWSSRMIIIIIIIVKSYIALTPS